MNEDIGTRSEGCAGAGVTVLVIFGIICLLLSMCACKTQYKVVEVPRVVTQTNVEHRTNIVRDTLLRRDSVIIVQRGDTVYHETWHHLQAINRTYIADTVRDTIPQIVTVTKTEVKEVEKKLTKWQRIKMNLGGWLLAAVALLLIGGGVYGIIKLRKIVK
jgi:hypothetical protein